MAKKWKKEDLETRCLKCGEKILIKKPEKRKGESGIRGECPNCGNKVFKILH